MQQGLGWITIGKEINYQKEKLKKKKEEAVN